MVAPKIGDVAGFIDERHLQRGFIFPSRRFPFVPDFSRLCRFLPLVYITPHQYAVFGGLRYAPA